MHSNNRDNRNNNNSSNRRSGDWLVHLKVEKFNPAGIKAAVSQLRAQLNDGRDRLLANKTGVSKERPIGYMGIEKLRITGRMVVAVMVEGHQIGAPYLVTAPPAEPVSRSRFARCPVSGLMIPAQPAEPAPAWMSTLKAATAVLAALTNYAGMGQMVLDATKAWHSPELFRPLADAVLQRFDALGVTDPESFIYPLMEGLIWPAVNGRNILPKDAMSLEPLDPGKPDGEFKGCWVLAQADRVLRRAAELEAARAAEAAAADSEIVVIEDTATGEVVTGSPEDAVSVESGLTEFPTEQATAVLELPHPAAAVAEEGVAAAVAEEGASAPSASRTKATKAAKAAKAVEASADVAVSKAAAIKPAAVPPQALIDSQE